jgi:hypothetical protein
MDIQVKHSTLTTVHNIALAIAIFPRQACCQKVIITGSPEDPQKATQHT